MGFDGFSWKKYYNSPAGKEKKRLAAKARKAKLKEKEKEKKALEKERIRINALKKYNPKYNQIKLTNTYTDQLLSVTAAQRLALHVFSPKEGKKISRSTLMRYVRTPEEIFELNGDKIIRTVSAYHYISKRTETNGLCRSFAKQVFIHLAKGTEMGEEVFNVYDEILAEFRKRYYCGRIMKVNLNKGDLDVNLSCHRLRINKVMFFIVSAQNLDGTYNPPRLFRVWDTNDNKINTSIELILTQEQIIDRLKSGEIKTVTKYGDPSVVYTNEDVLAILNIK